MITDSRRVLIYGDEGIRNLPFLADEISRFLDLILWRRMMSNGRIELHIFKRAFVSARRYLNEVLKPQIRLFRAAVGPEVLLMAKNARPYRIYVVSEYFQTEDITGMDWQPYLPELKPIADVLDALGREISAYLFLSRFSRSSKVHFQKTVVQFNKT